MIITKTSIASTLVLLSTVAASAQALVQTGPTTEVSVNPLVAAITPIVVAIIGVVLKLSIDKLAAAFVARTGVQLQQVDLDRFEKTISNYAGVLLAKGDASIVNAQIDVGNPQVASLTNLVIAEIPQVLTRLGITADGVAQALTGKIGHSQMASPSSAPVPVPSK